jgi:hypothetical protein
MTCSFTKFYLLAGVEKSGRNAEGDSWWETWQENLHQDEWRSLSLSSCPYKKSLQTKKCSHFPICATSIDMTSQ